MLALVERVLKQQRQELADALELLMHALGVACSSNRGKNLFKTTERAGGVERLA